MKISGLSIYKNFEIPVHVSTENISESTFSGYLTIQNGDITLKTSSLIKNKITNDVLIDSSDLIDYSNPDQLHPITMVTWDGKTVFLTKYWQLIEFNKVNNTGKYRIMGLEKFDKGYDTLYEKFKRVELQYFRLERFSHDGLPIATERDVDYTIKSETINFKKIESSKEFKFQYNNHFYTAYFKNGFTNRITFVGRPEYSFEQTTRLVIKPVSPKNLLDLKKIDEISKYFKNIFTILFNRVTDVYQIEAITESNHKVDVLFNKHLSKMSQDFTGRDSGAKLKLIDMQKVLSIFSMSNMKYFKLYEVIANNYELDIIPSVELLNLEASIEVFQHKLTNKDIPGFILNKRTREHKEPIQLEKIATLINDLPMRYKKFIFGNNWKDSLYETSKYISDNRTYRAHGGQKEYTNLNDDQMNVPVIFLKTLFRVLILEKMKLVPLLTDNTDDLGVLKNANDVIQFHIEKYFKKYN